MHGVYTQVRNAERREALAREGLETSQPRAVPDRNYLAFAPEGIIITSTRTPYFQGSQASLSAQPTPLRGFLGWSNQNDSETSQASHRHPIGATSSNFSPLIPSPIMPVFGRLFLFPHTHGHAINLTIY